MSIKKQYIYGAIIVLAVVIAIAVIAFTKPDDQENNLIDSTSDIILE